MTATANSGAARTRARGCRGRTRTRRPGSSDRAERGDELERDVVRQDDVEDDDQQRGEREVELPRREAGVEVVRPARDPPRQEVVAQEGGEPDVRAGVATGDRGVAQHAARARAARRRRRSRRRRSPGRPSARAGRPAAGEASSATRDRRRAVVVRCARARRSPRRLRPSGQHARRTARRHACTARGSAGAGELEDVHERDRAVGGLPRLRLAPTAPPERERRARRRASGSRPSRLGTPCTVHRNLPVLSPHVHRQPRPET